MATPRQGYPTSRFAMLFPEMAPEDYQQLVASIREQGLLDPIALWRGEVIDGRHRQRACIEVSVVPRYEHLDPETDPVEYILAKNLARRHLDATQRALIAHGLSRDSRPGGDRRSAEYRRQPDHSAKLPNGLSQQQAAERLAVSPRLVRDAGRVMTAEGPAAVALQRAVRERRVKISDAKQALTQPTEVQERALELVSNGTARSLASAIRRLNEEGHKGADDAVLAVDQAKPLDEAITLHQVGLSDLHELVSPASVDAIITHPPHGPESLPLLPHLAAFAAHALQPEGVLVVISGADRLPDTLEGLKHDGLRWLSEFDYRDNATGIRSGPPHRIQLRRKPLLVYCKPGFRMPPGDDVIEVPVPVEGMPEVRPRQRNDTGLFLISQRFSRPGQVLCDPLMLGRASTVLAARKLGCAFIGADREASSIARVRRYLEEYEHQQFG